MNKLQTVVQAMRVFVDEVVSETKKTTWPERQELLESTVVVIVSVLMLAVFVGVSDKILVTLLKLLITPGRM
jgi:preprotein translocase subunit SecE